MSSGGAPSGVAVVVVAYGQPESLSRCLVPLTDRYPITVVDNSSDDACARVARAASARYLDPGINLGFAAAVNRALQVAVPGQDLLLLNPDAVIDPGAVDRLHRWLHAPGNERVAAVAPRQFGDDGTAQRVSWPFPSPIGTWADAFGLGHLFARPEFLVGSALLLRRAALEQVGCFDERFFLYAEEVDWQWRAQRAGWSASLCSDAVAYHQGGGTSTDGFRREILFHSSFELYIRKWYGSTGWASARAAATAGAILRLLAVRAGERRRALRQAKLYVRGPHRSALACDAATRVARAPGPT